MNDAQLDDDPFGRHGPVVVGGAGGTRAADASAPISGAGGGAALYASPPTDAAQPDAQTDVSQPSGCGDGARAATEQCDGADLGGSTCATLGYGFSGGELACDPITCAFDLSQCQAHHECGNGVVEPGEQCEGTEAPGEQCASYSLGNGRLRCHPDSCQFDTSACRALANCGDGVIGPGEQCDGDLLGGTKCADLSFGFDGGTLTCDPRTCTLDTTSCVGGPSCGDGIVQPGEDCEGTDVGAKTCQALGFNTGKLACNAATCRFDLSACYSTCVSFRWWYVC